MDGASQNGPAANNSSDFVRLIDRPPAMDEKFDLGMANPLMRTGSQTLQVRLMRCARVCVPC